MEAVAREKWREKAEGVKSNGTCANSRVRLDVVGVDVSPKFSYVGVRWKNNGHAHCILMVPSRRNAIYIIVTISKERLRADPHRDR